MAIVLSHTEMVKAIHPAEDYTGTSFNFSTNMKSINALLSRLRGAVVSATSILCQVPQSEELEHAADHFLTGIVNQKGIDDKIEVYYSALWNLYGKPVEEIDGFEELIKSITGKYIEYVKLTGKSPVVTDEAVKTYIAKLKETLSEKSGEDFISKIKKARALEMDPYRILLNAYLANKSVRNNMEKLMLESGMDPALLEAFAEVTFDTTQTETNIVTSSSIIDIFEKNYKRAVYVYQYIIALLLERDVDQNEIKRHFLTFHAGAELDSLNLDE